MLPSNLRTTFGLALFIFNLLNLNQPILAQNFHDNRTDLIERENAETSEKDSNSVNTTDYKIDPLLPVIGGVVTAVWAS